MVSSSLRRVRVSFAVRIAAVAAVCAGIMPVCAGLVEVTDVASVTVSSSGDGITARTQKSDGLPEDLPTPIFWFDCSNTNGWQIVHGDDGTNYVTMIPSLGDGGRFLTTDTTLEGTSFTGWGNRTPNPPALVEYEDLPGGPVLDFGKFGSGRGMMFNPCEVDGASKKNILSGIGAMAALWGSQEGGGYLFGGGNIGSEADTEGREWYRWVRGWDNCNAVGGGTAHYWTSVLGSFRSSIADAPGFYMHDGIPTSAELTGMNGGWEAIGLVTDAPKWSATGIGLGDARADMWREGGCRIGEMLVFGEALTQDQMRRLQLHLREKWLAKGLRGWNGDANVGAFRAAPKSAARAIVDVPAGETLTLQTLAGGRGGGSFSDAATVKTGAGVLKVNAASDHSAPIELAGGTLELSRKAPPESVEELPYGLYMRFDASEESSMTLSLENGTNFVERMNNLASGRHLNRQIFLKTVGNTKGDLRPWVNESPLGSALPIIDFGARTQGAAGRYLCFYTEDEKGESKLFEPAGCGTLVGLVCAEHGGGHICNGPFRRGDRWVTEYTAPLLMAGDKFGAAQISNTNSETRLFLNGMRVAPTNGFLHAGCQVIAYQVQPAAFAAISAEQYYTENDGSASGGVMFGELLFWNRPLSDDELLAAQAYLSRKWLGTDIPGYAASSDGVADMQSVRSAYPSSIDVPGSRTMKIARLDAKAPLSKVGDGTLLVGPESDLSGLTIAEGSVEIAAVQPETSSNCEIAPGAALHLDASAADSFILGRRDGTNFVQSWYSPNGVPARQTNMARQPWLVTDEDELLNGKPVVDFGPFVAASSAEGRCLPLAQPLDSVRSVFIVRGSQSGGGVFLGESSNVGVTDWARSSGGANVPIIDQPAGMVLNGEFYLDGALALCTNAFPTGGYELIDVHTTVGAHVSALACRGGERMYGGVRIAELLIYQRPLSEREKVATRNYLTRKWFPSRTLQDLPDAVPVDAALSVGEIPTDGERSMDVSSNVSAKKVSGDGFLEKTGSAELSVSDLSDMTGTIAVEEGSLAIVGQPLAAAPELVTNGRILHLDASVGLSLVTNADNTVSVAGWRSILDDGWVAVPGASIGSGIVHNPTLLPYELNGLPTVKMAYHGWAKGEEYFLFQKNGEQKMLEGIRSVFWVIGSQEGGGFLMGGGVNPTNETRFVWHRGGDSDGATASDALLLHHAQDELERAAWRLNGADINCGSDGLTGGYDLLSMVMTNTAGASATADGLAFDGRILAGEDYRARSGRQRIGELIVYNRGLSDSERLQVESYLAAKWGFAQKSTVNSATVDLASGTQLKTTGRQYVDTLSGVGEVVGDVVVRGIEKDCSVAGTLSVSGTITISENPVFTVRGLPSTFVAGDSIVIATAGAIVGAENVSSATIIGVPDRLRPRISVRGGKLTLRFDMGMQVIVR